MRPRGKSEYKLTGRIPVGVRSNQMTITTWLEAATQDAERRGLPALKPLLEALAKSTSALRAADWNADPSGRLDAQKPNS